MKINVSFILGGFVAFAVCFPYSFPSPPMYVFSYLSLLFVLVFSFVHKKSIPLTYLIFYFLLVVSLSISTLISEDLFTATAFLGIFISPLFFSVGFWVDHKSFFRFFWIFSAINSAAIIIFYLSLGIYKNGVSVFIISELRMWGENIFFDWPNYIVMTPILAIYSHYLFTRKIGWFFIINAIAALLTTSRTAILALGIYFCIYLIEKKKYYIISFLVIITSLYIFPALIFIEEGNEITNRLLKTGDREHLFTGLYNAFLQKPLLGWGVVSVPTVFPETYYNSFHNSFLEAAVRGGILNLTITIAFLMFMFVRLKNNSLVLTHSKATTILFFTFILLGCLTQNFLKHPNVAIILSMIFFSKVTQYETNSPEHS